MIDGAGLYGSILTYTLTFLFGGSAALVFFYLWKKGRLDMDEGPKFEMMERDEERPK